METSGNRTALGVSADVAQLVGNRLRRARESIGRSTSALSAKIKVREHYLVAIEDGQWNELPPGLNGRGLVRIYARELSVSVPELDQAANPSVMPAEQDAQAPYQVNQKREHTSADRDTVQVRTVSGGGSHSQRVTEVPPRTNTLSSGQKASRLGDLPPVSEMKRPVTATPGFKGIESNPEEEPLDVVTPDVASILGITLETFEEAPKPRRAVEAPAQRVEPVHSDDQGRSKSQKKSGKNKGETKAAPRSTQTSQQNEEMPLILPEVFAQQSGKNTNLNSAVLQNGVEERKEPTVAVSASVPAPIIMVEQVSVVEAAPNVVEQAATVELPAVNEAVAVEQSAEVTEMISVVEHAATAAVADAAQSHVSEVSSSASALDIAPSTAPGVNAAEAYLKSHAAQDAPLPLNETEAGTNKGLGQPTRWAIGLVAASVVALVVGQVFMRPETSAPETQTADTPSIDAAQGTSQAASQDDPESGTMAGNPASDVAQPAAVDPSAAVLQETEQAVAAATQPQSQAVENSDANKMVSTVSPQEGVRDAAVAAAESEQQPVVTEGATQNATPMSGATAAVLTLSEPLEIQITADGKKIFAGKHNAGKVEIKFNKRAEIIVQDGSKARLQYAGWDHGSLGLLGRKRRIVLNAEKFSGSSN